MNKASRLAGNSELLSPNHLMLVSLLFYYPLPLQNLDRDQVWNKDTDDILVKATLTLKKTMNYKFCRCHYNINI